MKTTKGEVDVTGSFVQHVNQEEAELADAWLSNLEVS
jgi:hypothetical protein